MAIVIEGIKDAALRRVIGRKLDKLSRQLPRPPVAVRVDFTDENGPKGGVDRRCGLTIELPRRAALHAEDVAPTARAAFDLAFESLQRRVLREVERLRDQRRRPKKYFVAKRLLETPSTPPRRRRRRA